MFEKLKQIGELKKMQEQMKQERVEASEKGVKVVLNGNFEVEEIVLDPELALEEQAGILRSCFNRAAREVQMKIAKSFSGLI